MIRFVYLGLSILEISKIVMYEFWYDYIKPKYNEKAKLCYIDANSFIANVKAEDVQKYIAKFVIKRFDTSNHKLERPFPKGEEQKILQV